MTDGKELKGCPFCGKEPKIVSDGEHYTLSCPYKDCPSNQIFDNRYDAAEAWNTRPPCDERWDKAAQKDWEEECRKAQSREITMAQKLDQALARLDGKELPSHIADDEVKLIRGDGKIREAK